MASPYSRVRRSTSPSRPFNPTVLQPTVILAGAIMLPLVSNGIVVLVIVNFVTAWGEYLLAITLTNDQVKRTVPVVLASAFGGLGEWDWPRIAAVYIMVIAPGILAFAVAQRWYMRGLLEGALKA